MASLAIPARCDRAATEAMLASAREAAAAGPVTVDASQVEQPGLALLQLLLALRRGGAEIAPSPALTEAAQLLRLEHELFGTAAS